MAGIITPATIYVKVVITAKAGIQICRSKKMVALCLSRDL